MAARVGTLLDRYRIDAELGRGAMGVVYRARDPKLDRTVAIKTISIAGLEANAEREYRRRFVVEAQAAGRLSHPGIVTIFDVREEAEPYLVMEYVEGKSLQQLVGRERPALPLATTLRLIQEITEALHYAHAQGVVHRDIKPANILLTSDSHPKIADFGIAQLNQSDLTIPGRVLGSPAYMAPEQLSDEKVDARSDLFSLGVILYYLLTGHRPFQGQSTTTVCFKLVNHDPISVSSFGSDLPVELDRIVSRAIAKDPGQRYQSGAEMASAIQGLRESTGLVEKHSDDTAVGLKRARVGSADFSRGAGIARAKEGKSWEVVMLSFLLVAALASIAFWNMHRGKVGIAGPGKPAATPEKTEAALPQPPTSATGERARLSPVKSSASNSGAKDAKASAKAARKVPADALLQIEIEHHFAEATAWVWVDNALVLTQPLHGDSSGRSLFRKVAGHQFKAIRVAPGQHQVRVQIHSATDAKDQSTVIAGAFSQGSSTLRIVCGNKREGLRVSLQ